MKLQVYVAASQSPGPAAAVSLPHVAVGPSPNVDAYEQACTDA